MKEIIRTELKKIEESNNIKIIYACESGSRAWGFPSKDSDYDVRFIYVRPLNWYICIENKPDIIELPINNELDINGWDIRKALALMYKYNAPLAEWLSSPIIYYEIEDISTTLKKLAINSFDNIRCFYHYLSLAKKKFATRESKSFHIKSFLYFLRATLSASWVYHKSTQPPMDITELMSGIELELNIVKQINSLISFKATSNEKNQIPEQYQELLEYSYELFIQIDNRPNDMQPSSKLESEYFNTQLFDIICKIKQ